MKKKGAMLDQTMVYRKIIYNVLKTESDTESKKLPIHDSLVETKVES